MKLSYLKGDEDADSLYQLKHVYSLFKTIQDGKVSDDVICVIVPPGRSEAPENPNSMAAFKSLQALTPKHMGPKVGSIQIAQTDGPATDTDSGRNVEETRRAHTYVRVPNATKLPRGHA